MTAYARIVDGQVVNTYELTADQYAALVANGKAAHLRLWIVDPQPTPSATQVVAIGPVVVGPVEAHQTWVLRNKTQAELDIDANAAEYAQIKAAITGLTADIQAYNANPDMTGTVAEWRVKVDAFLKNLDRQVMRNNRAIRFLLRNVP